jgi:hypothetical protein
MKHGGLTMSRKLSMTVLLAALLGVALFASWGVDSAEAALAPYATRLAVGEYAQVLPPDVSYVRSDTGRRLGSVPEGGIVYILDGPNYHGNMIWWYIDYPETGLQGWMSEGRGRAYYMAPWDSGIGGGDTPPVSTTGLSVGDLAFVITSPDNIVRRKAGLGERIIGRFPAGNVLEIQDGPRYANGMVWWKAYSRSQNVSGWTPEGQNGTAFLAHVIGVTQCANSARSILAGHDRAYVLTNTEDANQLRNLPSTREKFLGKPVEVIGQIQPGETMTVIGGPYCDADSSIIWWKVSPDANPRLRGWTAESEDYNYYLAPLNLY